MPEDAMKPIDDAAASRRDLAASLEQVRDVTLNLVQLLKDLGKDGLAASREGLGDTPEEVLRKGRQVLHVVEDRLIKIEKAAEHSVKERPRAWAGGLLGVVGFGLVLGLILRQRD